jgi:hypothetical protein
LRLVKANQRPRLGPTKGPQRGYIAGGF